MIAVRVLRAWGTAGSRKAPTPLLTASTPVIAVQPLAKARIRIQRLAAMAADGMAAAARPASGWPPASSALTTPMASTASSETMNR